MFYSKQTNGFYLREIHGDFMPSDVVEITEEFHAELMSGQAAGLKITGDENGYPILVSPEVSGPFVPSIVTMRQARLALLSAGKLAQVDAVIDSLPEPHKSAARIEWDYSSEVQRDRPFVQQIGAALGYTDEQLDQLFIEASKL